MGRKALTQPPLHVVVLAAGQGTRMKSALPKVLHPVGGRPMLAHVLQTARAIGAARCHVVHGHGAEAVRAAFADAADIEWALQDRQLGTAHAVQQAMPAIPDQATVLVLYGDTPLIAAATLQPLLLPAAQGLVLLTTQLERPAGYGRILRRAGRIAGIVEENDATAAQKKITEVNTGVIAAPAGRLRAWLSRVGNRNAKKEFYLTDVVALAVKDRLRVQSVAAPRAEEVEGVNDRAQLARMERVHQRGHAEALMAAGLHIADPARFDLRGTLRHGRDCNIDVGVVIEGAVELGDDVRVGPYVILRNARIGSGTRIDAHSVIDFADTGRDCRIGPFARLRPETALGDEVHIGNFVEVKKSGFGRGSKANHLAYVGDSTVGEAVNIGAGTITCNYDGVNKHRTMIGDGAFIGSNSALVAPVTIGAGATVGAGSVISKDAPAGELTVARARQLTLPGWKRPEKKK